MDAACYSDWFIQVILPLHHHRCLLCRQENIQVWSKLLWRSLTYQLLPNKHQPCQHSQITWKIREVLAYSCTTDVKEMLSCLLTGGRTRLSQDPFCSESRQGEGVFSGCHQHPLQEGFQIRLEEWETLTTGFQVDGTFFPRLLGTTGGHTGPKCRATLV